MMYDDHDRSRFQIPAEPLVLADNTYPCRDQLIRTNHLIGERNDTYVSGGGT
jgi:hypothetical protein